jgi:serine/threonine-protein kinase
MSETMQDALRTGEQFHGYVVQKLLGKGSSGAVYLVRHEVLDTLYALKILGLSTQPEDQTNVKRFLREARLASRIRHPNLVSVHDCGYDAGRELYYLVMDYVPGSSLRDSLAFEGRFQPERAVGIVAQVASALEAAQPFKVVHRDIKPENILIEPDGRVKLVDLGIAKAQDLGDTLETSADSVFGTTSYISPEQAQCSADVDARADIYSLGVVLFEMLTGQCPYADDNPMAIISRILSDEEMPDIRDVVPGVSPELAVLIRRMTLKDRDRRIATFGAVLAEIGKLGYGDAKPVAPAPEYAARPVPGMKTLLDGIGGCREPASNARGGFGGKTVVRESRTPLRWLMLAACAALVILAIALVFL